MEGIGGRLSLKGSNGVLNTRFPISRERSGEVRKEREEERRRGREVGGWRERGSVGEEGWCIEFRVQHKREIKGRTDGIEWEREESGGGRECVE